MAGVVAGGAGMGWVVEVEAVVGDEGALGECGLGGAELHVAVDGDGVAGEDLAAERWARASESAVLPEAVAPRMTMRGRMTNGFRSGSPTGTPPPRKCAKSSNDCT